MKKNKEGKKQKEKEKEKNEKLLDTKVSLDRGLGMSEVTKKVTKKVANCGNVTEVTTSR